MRPFPFKVIGGAREGVHKKNDFCIAEVLLFSASFSYDRYRATDLKKWMGYPHPPAAFVA